MPSPIFKILKSSVLPHVVAQGETLVRQHKSYVYRKSNQFVYGDIREGINIYTVNLDWTSGYLTQHCTCPQNDDGGVCRHVYALAAMADERNYLSTLETRHIYPDAQDLDALDPNVLEATLRQAMIQQGLSPDLLLSITGNSRLKLKNPPPQTTSWKQSFAQLTNSFSTAASAAAAPVIASDQQILYDVQIDETLKGKGIVVVVGSRKLKKNGQWSVPKDLSIQSAQIAALPDPADRELVSLLQSCADASYDSYSYYSSRSRYNIITHCRLPQQLQEELIRKMCLTGRCRILRGMGDLNESFLTWDDSAPWRLVIEGETRAAEKTYALRAHFQRDDQQLPINQPKFATAGGILFTDQSASRLHDDGVFPWIALFRQEPELSIPFKQADAFLKSLAAIPAWPELRLPENLRLQEVHATPIPKIKLSKERFGYGDTLIVKLDFEYDGHPINADTLDRGILFPAERKLLLRNAAQEKQAKETLLKHKCRPRRYGYGEPEAQLEISSHGLPALVRALAPQGWKIEAEGKLYRNPGNFDFEVTTGIDWFDLSATLNFDGHKVTLPDMLAALRRGDSTIVLADGTMGILPEDALKKCGIFAGVGTAIDGSLRFTRAQAGLLDALLAAQPQAQCDAAFHTVRQEMRAFQGVHSQEPPATFQGQLRPYQSEGLGWFEFLRKFSFGGCLADDMGLGKTVQVLAMLEQRRLFHATQNGTNQSSTGVSPVIPLESFTTDNIPAPRATTALVVAPRSLIFNWKQEAARFTPNLRLLDHTGNTRSKTTGHFEQYEVVLTTYGTLRRDAAFFKDAQFDYVILDEAQAIKNASTDSAKAVRLLNGRHRLALSGTPVENHLRELWSLFEFLNPGMLGSASIFQKHIAGTDADSLNILAQALRPFILRRTKEQVATELPKCTEQTLFCELPEAQRTKYDELRDYYRKSLLQTVETQGMGKAKIQILEALLRLRQAACHPGLIDKNLAHEPSAKLDMLLEQLEDVLSEGHKALVFSQFTSMLAILKKHLEKRLVNGKKIPYVYLDGKTRDRQAVVENFQNDSQCQLFLISLKAGGLGLNLTSADYVFLLDPWWNPAVEAQAIDRAHRIGQQKPVFAYRLIAKDTVEEKVLQLQQTKRDLADAIIGEKNSLISGLSRDDLQLLLS